MTKKELMLLEIARIYKGITVAEYERMFAGVTADEIEAHLQDLRKKGQNYTKGEQL